MNWKLWDGDTWLCVKCQWVNAIHRRRCRHCGADRPSVNPA